ncbi:reelin domain-containing protein 1 [Trichosurus vulpecula]|uniref:reelin domain-containing protein 1 n=1 Tax=Trichosurus vulpecula TaxID=9337 RepID=UPI00186B0035|nr:reelin domain-containing protein 1 [Trichosurus vulpecula]
MKIQVAIIGWAYATFCLVPYTDAFSHGASLEACVDMKPRHIRAQLQNPRNNYITIFTNVSSYSPGDEVPVTVRSRGDFMGFLLQARRLSNDQIAGTFVFIPSGSKLMSCFEEANTVTHSDKSPKRNLSFVWKAPQQPTGDIKFFLSVVQSYFIYWERIESTIVSQQTQNRTLSDGNVEPAMSLQQPNGLEVTTTVSRPQIILIQHTQPAELAVISRTGTSVTDSLEPVLGGLTTEVPEEEMNLLKPYPLHDMSIVATSSDQRRQPDWESHDNGGDQTLEPSLNVRGLEKTLTLGSFTFEDYSSSHNIHNRTVGGSDSGTAEPCLHCDEGEQERPEAYNLTLTRSASSMGAPFTAHLSYSQLIMVTKAEAQTGGGPANSSLASKASAALRQVALRLAGLPKSSANFLPQSQYVGHREEGDGEDSTGLPHLTRPVLETVGVGLKEDGSPPRTGIVTAQLGILLCLSATLGMALAAGLRCLHAQYCRQRTEASFGEPDSDIIAVRDSGERTHFRKIRENSIMLVQAEYNWVTPKGRAQRTAV